MTNEIFLDTSFAVALISPRDQLHRTATRWLDRIETDKIPIVATYAILLEIGNALSKRAFRQIAIGYLENLENDPNTVIVSLTDELYAAAFELFSNRPDKEWGLVDCVSFVVMREREITDALTADEHFTQAGFRALLRDN